MQGARGNSVLDYKSIGIDKHPEIIPRPRRCFSQVLSCMIEKVLRFEINFWTG